MTEKAHERYAVRHPTIIITGFLHRLSSRFLLPESNFRLELSQFLIHLLLRGGNGAYQLQELHVDVEG